MSFKALLSRSVQLIKEEGFKGYLQSIRRFYKKNIATISIVDELRWFYSKLRFPELVIREVQGSKMYLPLSDSGISKCLFLHRYREPECTRILKEELKEGMTVADVGANIGYYVLIEAQIVGKAGKIYAVEPAPKNFEILQKNISLNSYADIVDSYCMAMSNKSGKDRLYISKYSNCHSMFKQKNNASGDYAEVSTMSFDDFIKDKRHPDFIRMDVEGYEYLIIDGMKNTLNRDRPCKLFIEVHPVMMKENGYDAETMLKTLLDSGFKPKFIVISDSPLKEKSIKYEEPVEEFLNFLKDNQMFMNSFGLFMEKA